MPETAAKTNDPSGGTTGRVKLYGRLGWMGARAEYSLDGEGLPLPPTLVAAGSRRVQTTGDFFNAFGARKRKRDREKWAPILSCSNKKIARDGDSIGQR